jgi:outer membrane beta-barrel protein
MRTRELYALLIAALLALPGLAAAPSAATKPAGSAASDDDDEEPVTKPAAKPAATPAAPAQEGSVSSGAAPTVTDQQKLVSGAPLYNPNVAVHIVEQKPFSDRLRLELIAYFDAQFNGKFTQHAGGAISVLWHVQENIGVQLTGFYNPLAIESGFNDELVDKTRSEAQAATSLLLVWGLQGGVEVTPLYGKFAFFDGVLGVFSVVLNGGAGVGFTRHQLKPINQNGPATFGDTGARFAGEVGGGFRLQLGNRFALRLEVKDIIYSALFDQIEGCYADDLNAMNEKMRAGGNPSDASVRPTCNTGRFEGTNPDTNQRNQTDVPLAYNLVRKPSSDVLNNVGVYLGISVLIP